MSQEIASPLADIIRKAAERRPKSRVTEMRERFDRRFEHATAATVVLVDDSESMSSPSGPSGQPKRVHAQAALADVLKYNPKIRMIAFSSTAVELTKPILPELNEGTFFVPALRLAALMNPRKVVIISDGQPSDDEKRIVEVVEEMTGAVDTIYCGPDQDPGAKFLRSLSKDFCGEHWTWDGYGPAQLAATMRRMIGAPAGE